MKRVQLFDKGQIIVGRCRVRILCFDNLECEIIKRCPTKCVANIRLGLWGIGEAETGMLGMGLWLGAGERLREEHPAAVVDGLQAK